MGDQGSVRARSLVHHARAHGRDDVLAAEDDAVNSRSGAAAHHDDDAADVWCHVPRRAEWSRAVLVRRQPVRHWPAVLHELVDRPAGDGERQTASGAAYQERRVGSDRGRGEQELESRRTDHQPNREKRSVNETLTTQIATFVQSVIDAMGVQLRTTIEETPEATRINLEGEDGGPLIRRGGEGLQALQHLVATTFRRQLGDDNRIVVDCNGFRRDKDAEIRQMAKFIAEKARSSGAPQEMGPLNPYERRIVHLAIAEDPSVSSESIGDAFMKTVIISARR